MRITPCIYARGILSTTLITKGAYIGGKYGSERAQAKSAICPRTAAHSLRADRCGPIAQVRRGKRIDGARRTSRAPEYERRSP